MSVDRPVDEESFAALWHDLDRQRSIRGWTRARLARQISKLSQQPCSEKTMHDRMSHGRRIAWDHMRWTVLALELDEQSWKQRWQQADNAWHKDRTSRQPSAEPRPMDQPCTTTGPELPSTTPPSHETWSMLRPHRRLPFVGVGVAAGLIIVILAYFMNRSEQDRPQPAVACALVSTPTADVFLTPDAPSPIVTKKRGDRITLPVDTPVTVSPDRHRYRIVRTPRTPSGHAYMREDALASIPCDRPASSMNSSLHRANARFAELIVSFEYLPGRVAGSLVPAPASEGLRARAPLTLFSGEFDVQAVLVSR